MGFNKLFRKRSVGNTNDTYTRRSSFLSVFGSKKPSPSKQVKKALGGTYLSRKESSLRSVTTEDPTETNKSWKSCASRDYRQRSQLSYEDQQKQWGQAIVDAQRLPRTSAHFASNHIMVNAERTKRTIPALKRSRELDAVARWHAEAMAAENMVRHSKPKELQSMLGEDGEFKYLGENVHSGPCIRTIHDEMVEIVGDLRNMCDRHYKEMGMATALSSSGELYLCQIFRG
jgi:uncharacterized protein YkwD